MKYYRISNTLLFASTLLCTTPFATSALSQEGDTAASDAAETKTAILSLPYQAIFRTVPQDKLDTATNLLQKELGTVSGLTVIKGAVATEDAQSPSLQGFESAQKQAQDSETNRVINSAVEHRSNAVKELEQNAGALPKGNAKLYLNALHELARTHLLSGNDEIASKLIDEAARIAPTYDLDDAVYSRVYQKQFKAAADQAVREKRGSILVQSILPGATIEIDGRETGVAPIVLEKVVPGKHLVVARIKGVVPYSTVVTVEAKKQTEVLAKYKDTSGGDDVGVVADAIAKNQLPKAIVQNAIKAAKNAQAKWLVFGAMVKDADKFKVFTYVLNVENAKIKAIEQVNFDLELLTAESDVLRIVQAITKQVDQFDGSIAEIAKFEPRARKRNMVSKFNASPEYVDFAASNSKQKKKKIRRPIFRPLKGGTITIKDEEE
ncbi:MAG: PEGA domain-containing protein [Myxococcota bacterium]|nr:PEGA domain-containing protein [Myxococcota bacterium]